jgi:hypothetical protein
LVALVSPFPPQLDDVDSQALVVVANTPLSASKSGLSLTCLRLPFHSNKLGVDSPGAGGSVHHAAACLQRNQALHKLAYRSLAP